MLNRNERKIFLALALLYAGIVAWGSLKSDHGVLGLHVPSYFANKRNFVNKYFVKNAWLWFTLVFWTAVFTRKNTYRRLVRSALNYSLATIWWYLFTQWMFGPPLMDRIFTLTGGLCKHKDGLLTSSSLVCRKQGGLWHGGHDPSGHVFILVHSSLVLWIELIPDLRSGNFSLLTLIAPAFLILLWLFMLLTTAVYFHTPLEKFTGLVFGCITTIFIVYKYERRARR